MSPSAFASPLATKGTLIDPPALIVTVPVVPFPDVDVISARIPRRPSTSRRREAAVAVGWA